MFELYFLDQPRGIVVADFETVLRLVTRNRDLRVERLDCLQSLLDEFDVDCIFYGGEVPWTVEDVIDQYNHEMLTLEAMGLLEYIYEPETLPSSYGGGADMPVWLEYKLDALDGFPERPALLKELR